jgi:hypothetical protein
MANLLTRAKARRIEPTTAALTLARLVELTPRLRMRDGLNTKTRRAGFAGPRVAADAFALLTYDSNFFQNLRNETSGVRS